MVTNGDGPLVQLFATAAASLAELVVDAENLPARCDLTRALEVAYVRMIYFPTSNVRPIQLPRVAVCWILS
jgi:hypothetical protein